MRKLLNILRKDLYIRFTDVTALLYMFVTPMAVSLLMALAFGSFLGDGDIQISEIPVAVINYDEGVVFAGATEQANYGQQFVDMLIGSQGAAERGEDDEMALFFDRMFDPRQVDDEESARRMVEDGDLVALIVFPEDFSARVVSGEDAGVIEVYRSRGSDISASIVVSVVKGYANALSAVTITMDTAIPRIVEAVIRQNAAEGDDPFGLFFRTYQEVWTVIQGLVSRIGEIATASAIRIEDVGVSRGRPGFDPMAFLLPAMAIFFLMFSSTSGANSILEERNSWTLQRMMTTPTPLSSILAGKMLSVFATGVIQMAILIGASTLFGLKWGGNVVAMAVMVLTVSAAAGGLGAAIAGVAGSPERVDSYGSAFLIILGMLGGTFTPPQLFPDWLQALSKLTPNYWGADAFSILAHGGSLADVTTHVAVLLVIAVVLFSLGTWLLDRRIRL